ncbi:MAG: hypothetical protein JNL33_12225 [Betaproteobacteria bacterium]|nr:hypothetical protein [Betaproteobacteria bacterium]MBL8534611.1 hypothetical protein [Betaproteobacteria bacterium]
MSVARRITSRWRQFVLETHLRHSTFKALLVNLAILKRHLEPSQVVVVLVDSWREAAFLRLLGAMGIIRRSHVRVVRRTEDVPLVLMPAAQADALFVVTGTLFSRYHYLMAGARDTIGLLVI